jgi:membrane associated rhomboid family serine protease
MIYGGIELYLGFTQSSSNIAHFAHLGGMLFGFILIKIWAQRRDKFY